MTKINPGKSIRLMRSTDLDLVLAWRNHPDVRRYMFTKHEITMEEHLRWFEHSAQDKEKYLLIYEPYANPVGFIQFSKLPGSAVADWGFYAAPDAAKGSGRQLGLGALDYAFCHLNLHKVCGQALAFNEPSIRFHRALGFHQEGLIRDQHFDSQQYHDVLCFGLLRSEWQPDL
jgi:UDP-4-amino-4,6-dideoxy-N-acetyl-beta-L-altrosamine N-acetyltransferase